MSDPKSREEKERNSPTLPPASRARAPSESVPTVDEKIGDDVFAAVQGDPERVRRVVNRLLSNLDRKR